MASRFLNVWSSLAVQLRLDGLASQAISDELLRGYAGPDRHYHAVSHILFMLDEFSRLRGLFDSPFAAELAIFFHDLVYLPLASDNEVQSAVMMRTLLEGLVDEAILDEAAYTIEATQWHARTPRRDTNLVLDMDMAILGQPLEVYQGYAWGVMAEYLPFYGEVAYREGRRKLFLEPTLASGEIFLTPEFEGLMPQAIFNLQQEMDGFMTVVCDL